MCILFLGFSISKSIQVSFDTVFRMDSQFVNTTKWLAIVNDYANDKK